MRTRDTADRPPVGRFLTLFAGLLLLAVGLAWLSKDDVGREDAPTRQLDLPSSTGSNAAGDHGVLPPDARLRAGDARGAG